MSEVTYQIRPPVLLTRETKAAGAAEAWRRQYGPHEQRPNWVVTMKGDSGRVYEALVALGPAPNPDDVERVIGNDSWTCVGECNGCGERPDALVRVGEEPSDESSTAHLCKACLEQALALLDPSAGREPCTSTKT